MNLVRHISPDDLAVFAMHLLEPDQTSAVVQHVEHCPECRAELEAVRGDLAIYAMTAEQHTPPAAVRQRLMKQVSREKKFIPPPPVERAVHAPTAAVPSAVPVPTFSGRSSSLLDIEEEAPRRNVAAVVFMWTGWAVAAGIAVTTWFYYRQITPLQQAVAAQKVAIQHLTDADAKARQIMDAMTDPTAMHVTLTKAETPAIPIGRATYEADRGTLVFLASNMEPLEPYKTYELWLIPADGRDPIAAGTFHPDPQGNANVIMPDIPKGVVAKAFGITVEDEGGSQTPTKPIIMVGM